MARCSKAEPVASGAGRRGDGRRITLADVAKRAGVSSVTASVVLNDRPNCWASEATRQRIRKAAAALGYRPNLSARALRAGVSHVIGVVAPGAIATRTAGLTEAAEGSGYTVILSSHHNDSESEDLVIRRLIDRGVDGLAVYPVDPGPHGELRRLVQSGFPAVTFDGANLLDFPCDDISVDYEAVGRLQARHLLQLGRRRVCLARAIPEARINTVRESAVRDELKRAGAPAPLVMRVARPAIREFADPEPLVEAVRRFLAGHLGSFDAVIGFDAMASLAVRALHRLGVRVPRDVAVAGSGDSMLASYGVMPLTSVSTADDLAGAKAFGLLMDRIHGRSSGPFRRLTSSAELIVRESTHA
jgi:LacI family transcriptional regulator